MNWLKHLFHVHDWEDIEHLKIDVYDIDGKGYPIYNKYVYIQKCRICNKIRKQIIKF